MITREPVLDDWTEPEPVKAPLRNLLEPPNTTAGPQYPVRPPHPQFGQTPAPMAHVLDRLIHKLVDLRSDPGMTAITAIERLYDLNIELSQLAQQEYDARRRMERNVQDAQAQAALLADAERRGKGEQGVAQATDGIVGRAAHVVDPEQTGVMAPITEDTPDPRTAAVPADVSEGDVEQPESPVHEGDGTPLPLPSAEFLSATAGGSAGSALADRAMGLRAPSAPKQGAEVAS